MMVCKICTHPERAAIDKALVDQRSLRDVAGHYEVSRSSLDRHKQHIPKALTKAKQAETVAETTTLLSRVEKLATRCEALIGKAENDGHWAGAAGAARELRSCLELLAKLNGELQPNGARVAINFDFTKIDIRTLTDEQLVALYERVDADRRTEIYSMTNAEMDAALFQIGLEASIGTKTLGEAFLFDEVTVPPGPGYETNKRSNPKHPWRNASPEDRLRMLQAAWKGITGLELDVPKRDLGPVATIAVEFDLADPRAEYWNTWPKVRVLRTEPIDAALFRR